MILTTLQTMAVQPSEDATSGLRLPSAAGMGRAFLVLHTPSADRPTARAEETSEAIDAFIADLLELGGMAVVA
ncbi:MAG: hypothetical protein U0132_13220 [Gemmatimonadaceae bacterium]